MNRRHLINDGFRPVPPDRSAALLRNVAGAQISPRIVKDSFRTLSGLFQDLLRFFQGFFQDFQSRIQKFIQDRARDFLRIAEDSFRIAKDAFRIAKDSFRIARILSGSLGILLGLSESSRILPGSRRIL